MRLCYALICLLFNMSNQAYAFSMNPYAVLDSNSLVYEVNSDNPLENISRPKHEQHALNIINKLEIPPNTKLDFIEDVIAGVRWNDDPLGMAEHHKADFAVYFTNSCTAWQSKRVSPYWDTLYRTHCGDMQFLHAMASKPDELAEQTHEKMLMWLEFTYKVATGEIGYKTTFSEIPTKLTTDSGEIFSRLMTPDSEFRKDWTPRRLFTYRYDRKISIWNFFTGWITGKDITYLEDKGQYDCKNSTNECVQNVALGSLIHLLQDSYSRSHVKRDCDGNIEQFGLYTAQNHSKHKTADDVDIDTDMAQPNILSRQLIEIITLALKTRNLNKENIYNSYEYQSSWAEVQNLISGLIKPNNLKAPAGSIGYE